MDVRELIVALLNVDVLEAVGEEYVVTNTRDGTFRSPRFVSDNISVLLYTHTVESLST